MKNFNLLIAALLITFSASAQIQRGNVMVGGNFADINLGLDNSKIFSVDITPRQPGSFRIMLPLVDMSIWGSRLQRIPVQLSTTGLELWGDIMLEKMPRLYVTGDSLARQLSA